MISPVASTNVEMNGALMTAGSCFSALAPIGNNEPTLAAHITIRGNAMPTTRLNETG